MNFVGWVSAATALAIRDPKAREESLNDYRAATLADLEVTELLVAALYAATGQFAVFKKLSLLYFAAASFSESARRLNQAGKARTFLLRDNPVFSTALKRICRQTLQRAVSGDESEETAQHLSDAILRAIEPIDIAGLGKDRRPSWYPVDMADLFAGADKLGSTALEIHAMLERCGIKTENQGEPKLA